MSRWIDDLLGELNQNRAACRVIISRVEGSTPREDGAVMMVYEDHFTGSIGGGTLEHDVQREAKKALKEKNKAFRFWKDYPLGPTLGQCCGGFVTVMFEVILPDHASHWQKLADDGLPFIAHPHDGQTQPYCCDDTGGMTLSRKDKLITPLYLYGAGHVGRTVIEVTGGLPLERTWIDTAEDRFPDYIPPDVTKLVAQDLAHIANYAPPNAIHMVMSYSHQIDLEICLAVLSRSEFARLGLIGSATKRARFISALRQSGLGDDALSRLICPIGIKEIQGKEPFRVALSVAGQLAGWTAAS